MHRTDIHKLKEPDLVDRLLEIWSALDWLWSSLGIPYPFCWLGVAIPKKALLGTHYDARAFPGDVDLLAGPLFTFDITPEERERRIEELMKQMPRGHRRQWDQQGKLIREASEGELNKISRVNGEYFVSLQLVAEGRLQWPPPLDYLIGVNIKRSLYSKDDKLKSSKEGRLNKFLTQAENLCEMGLDRVLHLHLVPAEPQQDETLGFFHDATRGADALPSIRELYKQKAGRDHRFGIALAPWGAVRYATDEKVGGGIGRDFLREIPENPLVRSDEGGKARKAMAHTLKEIFLRAPKPRAVPVYLLSCKENGCGQLFVTQDYGNKACWLCRIPKIRSGIRELKKGLVALYGNRLECLVLFGSWAREEEDEGSDVDLLLVLKEAPDRIRESSKLSQLTSSLSLKYDVVFSVIPVDSKDYDMSATSFLATVKKEGIPL